VTKIINKTGNFKKLNIKLTIDALQAVYVSERRSAMKNTVK
jgi:hypothetical protein